MLNIVNALVNFINGWAGANSLVGIVFNRADGTERVTVKEHFLNRRAQILAMN